MLTLSGLRKSFGPIVALDGLSLAVKPGEVFGLLGPNGAGKSTTIGIITGLVTPDSGSIDINGSGSPTSPAVRRLLGVAPQSLALYDELSARENLEFFGSLFNLPAKALHARAEKLLQDVGLHDRAADRVKGFSGGMKRRLNLAVALVHSPPIVLLDEPTAGVDPQSRNNILEMVRGLRQAGHAVIYTTHYMEEAQKICDRVAIIDHGRLLALGPVEELISAHGGQSWISTTTSAGESRSPTTSPLQDLQTLVSRPDILSIRVDRPDLESVFLNLTGRSLRD